MRTHTRRHLTTVVLLATCWMARGGETEQLLKQSRDAYSIFDRAGLSRALAEKGVVALPELGKALEQAHWHVRHCALMTIRELARDAGNHDAIKPLVPKLAELLLGDPSLGVRVTAAECLGALGERGKAAQAALARAALEDKDPWVCASASSALTAVRGDLAVMMPVFEAMIRSTDRQARGEGVGKAGTLHAQGHDISPLVPALMDVFRKPIYDANYSRYTREPAMNLLLTLKVDTRELVPFIVSDLRSTWKLVDNGYHPYQKVTLGLLGRMGASGEAALPVLQEVIADPPRFGCDTNHPDYKTFITLSQESIAKIRAGLENKGARQ